MKTVRASSSLSPKANMLALDPRPAEAIYALVPTMAMPRRATDASEPTVPMPAEAIGVLGSIQTMPRRAIAVAQPNQSLPAGAGRSS